MYKKYYNVFETDIGKILPEWYYSDIADCNLLVV